MKGKNGLLKAKEFYKKAMDEYKKAKACPERSEGTKDVLFRDSAEKGWDAVVLVTNYLINKMIGEIPQSNRERRDKLHKIESRNGDIADYNFKKLLMINKNIQIKKITIFILCCATLIFFSPAWCYGNTSCRIKALGEDFVGIIKDEYTDLFFNPAYLGKMEKNKMYIEFGSPKSASSLSLAYIKDVGIFGEKYMRKIEGETSDTVTNFEWGG